MRQNGISKICLKNNTGTYIATYYNLVAIGRNIVAIGCNNVAFFAKKFASAFELIATDLKHDHNYLLPAEELRPETYMTVSIIGLVGKNMIS